jgi:lipoprotein-anchoring transpeptidase ErfK/SrfK
MRRYIYIHGCPDEDAMGTPSSHGCVKMRNSEVIKLFDRVPVGTQVLIQEAPLSRIGEEQ